MPRTLQLTLIPHPQHPVPAHWQVFVTLAPGEHDWQIQYHLPAKGLRIDDRATKVQRLDDLWRHTCCELFVTAVDQPGYREFNFAPSGHWAAYDFDDYRQRAPNLPELQEPGIECVDGTTHVLTVHLPATCLTAGPVQALRLGLTAVLEGDDGSLSYWALSHPGAKPDFHHRAGFVCALS